MMDLNSITVVEIIEEMTKRQQQVESGHRDHDAEHLQEMLHWIIEKCSK